MKTKEIGIKPQSELYFTTPSNQTKRLFYYITCIGHFYYEDNYKLVRDSYPSYLFLYVKKGTGSIFNGKYEYEISKGDLILIDCYSKHGYRSLGGLETIWFHFDGLNMKEIYMELEQLYEGFPRILETEASSDCMMGLMSSFSNNNRKQESRESTEISLLLSEFFSNLGRKERGEWEIHHMKEYIENHFKEDLSIKSLAHIANLSEFHFSRVFKKETGFTIHEYITKSRITHAKNKLQRSNSSLKEIAYECGYGNESSFSTIFKKHTGVTPGVFRTMKY